MNDAERRAAIPFLGSGIGYREELRRNILACATQIDFIEIVADHFIGGGDEIRWLHELRDAFTLVPHGLRLSIGSPRLDRDYLNSIKRVSDASGSPYYSDHLAVTRASGVEIGHLSPLWFTEEALEIVKRNVLEVQEVLQKPLILENISYAFEIPDATMAETEFLGRLVEQTGCGLLLDLANLHTNATNHDFNPVSWLETLPLDAIVQLHIAGGYWHEGVLIDGHCEPVERGTWDLFETLATRVSIKACILEHDDRFPEDFSVLLDEVERARRLLPDTRQYHPATVKQRR